MSTVLAPCSGAVLPVTDCVDPVFAGQIVGPGVVIDAEVDDDGAVPVVVAGADVGVLVHLGINTVKLEGRGFRVHVEQGATVEAGAPVITWNPADLPASVEGQDISRQVPVIVLDVPADSLDLSGVPEQVKAADPLFASP